jgi:hypothetical protein
MVRVTRNCRLKTPPVLHSLTQLPSPGIDARVSKVQLELRAGVCAIKNVWATCLMIYRRPTKSLPRASPDTAAQVAARPTYFLYGLSWKIPLAFRISGGTYIAFIAVLLCDPHRVSVHPRMADLTISVPFLCELLRLSIPAPAFACTGTICRRC